METNSPPLPLSPSPSKSVHHSLTCKDKLLSKCSAAEDEPAEEADRQHQIMPAWDERRVIE